MKKKEEVYKLPAIEEAPWLISTHDNHSSLSSKLVEKQAFFIINDQPYIKKIPELHCKSIMGSYRGWLILRERGKPTMYSIWNPITQQSILLPELPTEEKPKTCIFTEPYQDDCNNGTYSVLLLFFNGGIVFLCRPTARDDCWWVKQSLEHDGGRLEIFEVATVNGDIYAHADFYRKEYEGRIFVRMTIANDHRNSIFIERLDIECSFYSEAQFRVYQRSYSYLVEVCGLLYLVHIIPRQLHDMEDYDIVKALVWVLDLSQMKWIPVETLGDRAFLLGFNSDCTWCSAGAHIEGNCIYVASFRSQTLYQYRMVDNSYTLLKSHPDFLHSSDGPTWFMPSDSTRLSSTPKASKIFVETIEGNENIKHVGELEETNMEMPTSLLYRLPSDMLILITEYVHLFDYINLRGTSKTLHSKIPNPLPKWRGNYSYPQFMSLKNYNSRCQLWDPYRNINRTITTPHSPDFLSGIEFCKDGWLLLRTGGQSLKFLNPFTREKLTYLPNDFSITCTSFAFSKCPTSPDCLTVGISGFVNVTINLFRAGDEEWDSFEFFSEDGNEFLSNYNSSPKYHDGAFYFLDVNGNLGIFKLVEDVWGWRVHKGPIVGNVSLNSCYLADLGCRLISVFIEQVGGKVEVYKLDTLNMNWVALDDLGDYMLFVSPASSFSVSTKDNSNMRNRIYLPKHIGNEMVFYSLNTGMYHTSSGKHPVIDFYGMSSQSFCWL